MADLDLLIRSARTWLAPPGSGTPSSAAATGTSDSGTAVGDYLIIAAGVDYRTAAQLTISNSTGVVDLTGAAGWTQIAAASDGSTEQVKAWIGKVTTAGARTVTVNQATATSGLQVACITGDPQGGTVTMDGAAAAITDRTTPYQHSSITPAGTRDMLFVVHAGITFSNPTKLTYGAAPAGMTSTDVYYDPASGFSGMQVARQQLTSAAATGTRDQTSNIATLTDGGCGVRFLLRNQGAAGGVVNATAAVSAGMTMTAGGTAVPAVQASVAVSGGLAIGAGAITNTDVKATAPVTGTLSVTAGASLVSRVSAAITGTLSVAAAPNASYGVAAAAAGQLTFAATAVPEAAATAVLTGTLAVSLSPSRGQPVTAAIAGVLAVGATPGLAASAATTGTLDVSLTGKLDQAAATDMAGRLDIDVEYPYQGYATSAAITAALQVSAGAFRDRRDATAAITAVLTVNGSGTRVVTPTAAIAGALVVTSTAVRAAAPTLTISGALLVEAIAASSAGGALNVKLFAVDRQNGGALVPLPHWSTLAVSRQVNGAGSVAVEYPVFGRNFPILARDVGKDSDLEVEVWLGGRRSTRVVGYLQQANGDDVAEGATWQFTGVDMCARTDEIVVYPQAVVGVADLGSEVAAPQSSVTTPQWTQLLSLGYTGRDGDTVPTVYVPQLVLNAVKAGSTIPVKADDLRELRFNATSPGAVLNIVMSQCRARGGALDLTMDFTAARDSNGVPWPELVTAKWSPGTTASSILGRLVELGLIDWEITSDKVLRLFVQGTSGSLYTTGQSAVRLRRGINLAEATHRESGREGITAVLAAGSGGLYSDVTNTSAQARRGRRIEGYTTAGNIVDTDALLNVAQRTASLGAYGPDERTFAIAMGTGNPRPGPGQTFDKADTLLLDTTGTGAWITARVAQWTISVDPSGASGNVVVGDLISSRAAAILKRLTDTGDGSVVAGTSLPSGPDTGIPRAPDGLVVGSYAFAGGSSGADEYATVTASWQAVVYNTDNTACTDLAGYRVEWRQDGTTAWLFGADVPSGSTQGIWTTACGIPIYVRVRAYDRSGNSSTWTTLTAPHTTDDDTTPPGIPSTPIGGNYLGTVQVTWDGRDSNNADMYAAFPDFKVAYLHMSQAAEFVPDDSTLIDRVYGAGTYTYAKLPNGGSLSYGTTYYFKLVAEDQRGNRSAPSGQTEAVPGKLLGDDVFAKAIGSAALGDLVVKTANIDNLAVNDAKIASLGVGKLTAGTLTASMIVGTGKISTRADGTGAGWDGDSAGIRLYGPTGMVNVNFKTADGSAMVSGEYRTTNASTARMVINPGGASPAEMQFYPSSTAQYASLKVLTSIAIGYENQAGINMKAYSPRTDKQSGEVAVFPAYASIAWSNERDLGAVTARVAASQAEIFIGGNRTRISAPVSSGSDRVYGALSVGSDLFEYNGTQWGANPTVVTFTASSSGSGSAQILQWQNNSGIQFDRGNGEGILSFVKVQGGLCRIQAANYALGSSRSIKRDVKRLRGGAGGLDPLATIGRARARTYQLRDSVTGEQQVGLIAEELPELLRGAVPDPGDVDTRGEDGGAGTVDLYALITTVWEGLAQLKEQVDQMKGTT